MPPTPENLALQATAFGSIAEICRNAKRCGAISAWGFTDRYSWINNRYQGFGAALLFDDQYRPKPAYRAFVDALR